MLVIFDMDGVLADTAPIHFKSWQMLADKIGEQFTKEFFENTFGQRTIPIIKQLVNRNVKKNKLQKWAELKEKYYRELIKDKIEPIPGVISLIKELKEEKVPLAVGSSGPLQNVTLLLESLQIKDVFDVIITGADVKKGKPDPEVFQIIQEQLQISPDKCIVIEDAPVGIKAAKNARMKAIALTTTHKKEELKAADLILEDLSQVNYQKLNQLIKS
ncbi:MAG: hypothetical protein BAJALOKI1v1_1080007 [Promethearchaeota archaeon]|nr:MAG: hypothetical protein BAJALOKI1v1_1080007 [Candidatus Lokiarchaeota archaeon]